MPDKRRLFVLLTINIILFLLVVVRLVDLQIIHHGFYAKKSQEQRKRLITLAAQRGDIADRNGTLLSTSIDSYSVYQHKKGWLARKITLAQAEKIASGEAKTVSLLKEKKRVYPKGRIAAQLIGFVGLDNLGLSGLELSYDEFLRGKEGQVITEGDPAGRELYGALRELEPGSDGMNITLTIDENIQYVAEREIEAQIKKYQGVSGQCIVMDAKSGEILALASKPDFDPNKYGSSSRGLWHPRFLDPYEPGSTFKVITTAIGLDQGVIAPDSMLKALDTITVGGKVISNSHQVHWPGPQISVSKVLEESINTGVAQIGLKLGPEKFYQGIKKFGFGEPVGFGLKGESRGIVRHWQNWYKPDIAMMTFGQSIAVTPMQLLQAMTAFANDGILIQPFVVKKIESLDGKYVKVNATSERGRALSAVAAKQALGLMRNVVLRGSGRRAAIAGFAVCGKTGTAQKAIPGGRGYMKGHYIASFIGLAPQTDPKLICLIIVDDPKGVIWGETVCGPAFKRVVQYALRYLNVRPDAL